jgi:hypothetical protein
MIGRKTIALLLAIVLSGCASMRGVKVGSDNTASYRVEVHNIHSSTLTVSYTDTRGTHELGQVTAGSTQQFVIAAPSSTSVEIMGMTSAGGHYPKSITLATGSVVKVSL